MRILVGYTQSGRAVEVPVEQDEGASWLAPGFQQPEQRYNVYCMLTYLRAREETGWLLTPADRGSRFRQLLRDLLDDPATEVAIETARQQGIAKTTFDDIEIGRQLVLPGLRG